MPRLSGADCFSVDPSMIPRLSVDTYAAAFDFGAPVEARAVGRVVQSRADGWSEGDWALLLHREGGVTTP